ncbi:2-polyprenyl-3-methyl-6-methoxy-1,4-benzoquinone monooxygenase [Coxiella burnetii]
MSNNSRHYSAIDEAILQGQAMLETLFGKPVAQRENPAKGLSQPALTSAEKKQSIGFMRVNHSGEVCAQALYHGQMATAKNPAVRALFTTAAKEETDHLAWCQERLDELGGHTSYLNAFWYTNSFLIGLLAGLSGDPLSLGFVEETEKQVEIHLADHLRKIPSSDLKSRKIVDYMQQDEIQHGLNARSSGAKELPYLVKKLMAFHAKVMTTLAYWI